MLEFRILGPLEVLADGRPLRLGGPKQRAALAIMLLYANRVVSVERLADDLYAGSPPVTAVTQIQRQVSELRRLIGFEAIETRSPGYVLHVEPGMLDLDRFERSTGEAARALEHGDPERAAELLETALETWRGAPLADLAYESFAQSAIARLEELRLAALEQRFAAELERGRHDRILPELEALIWEHPLRERLRAQLMLALYRSGRQAEALEVYRRTRDTLVEEFGIEPSKSLIELERRILRQDPELDLVDRAVATPRHEPERSILLVPSGEDRLDALLSVAEPVATLPDRALLIARLVAGEDEVAEAASAVNERSRRLAAPVRAAAFTSSEPARDVVRLAMNYDVALVLLDLEGGPAEELAAVATRSPADVAVLAGPAVSWTAGGVFVPFGGGENDWAALELGAWLARAASVPLRLVGARADPARGRRDASRLLADASLAVQRVVGVVAEPQLVEPGEAALLEAVAPADVVLSGFSARWPAEPLRGSRLALLRPGQPSSLLVHRGTRPGVLAPPESRTRFSWSLEPA